MEIARYLKRGFHLFPIVAQTKKPAIADNLNAASTNAAKIKQWEIRFPKCNWGLSLAKSGLVCIDVDKDGLNAWLDLILEHGEPETLKANSGSGVGAHYVFKTEEGASYRGKLAKGIDVKHNGYIAVEPSLHPATGRMYKWVDFSIEPAPMPAWLKTLCVKSIPEKINNEPLETKDLEDFRQVAAFLKGQTFGYDEWVRLGMSLHSASGGSAEGLGIYLDITCGVNEKPGDDAAARAKWAGFKPGGVGRGTFFEIAKNLGWEGFNPGNDFDPGLDFNGAEEPDPIKENWKVSRAGMLVTDSPHAGVRKLNDMGYALLKGSYEGQIIKHWVNPTGAKHFKMMAAEHFKNSVRAMGVAEKLKNGQTRIKPVADVWLESSKKTTYNNVVFKPLSESGDLNLWSGIPCEPKKGDVSLFLELAYILCGKHEGKYNYFIKWLGHLFQKPEIKPVIVPVFIGEQGAGKGLFFDGVLGKILTSDYYSRLDKPGVIKERFNAEQARKFLTVLDEASWRGDHELNGILKSLTGSPTMTIEEKFGGRYSIENYSRYAILSNDIEAVRIETSNRRYLVFNTATDWKGTGKFKELAKELDAGGHKAVYQYLLGVDVSGFDPYGFPAELDTGTGASKAASFGPAGKFWYEAFSFHPSEMWDMPAALNVMSAWAAFSMGRGHLRHYTLTDFINETACLVPSLKGTIEGATWHVTPWAFMEAFFRDNRLPLPKGFDDIKFLSG